jgi:hypothetical protein
MAISALMRRIRRLSPPQQATLKVLCQHLARIAEHEYLNKMSASNLGLIFSTVVFGEDEGATLETLQNSKVSLRLQLPESPRAHRDENYVGFYHGTSHQAASSAFRGTSSRATTSRAFETPERESRSHYSTSFFSVAVDGSSSTVARPFSFSCA